VWQAGNLGHWTMTTEQWLLLGGGALVPLLLAAMIVNMVLLYRLSRESSQKAFLGIQSQLDQSIGQLRTYAEDVRSDYRRLDRMLRSPTEKGSLGEMSLESMLVDQLPKERYGIQKECLNGKKPDAHIKSLDGDIICIDSKFSLTNYAKMQETEDEKLREHYKKQFLRDMKHGLSEVASKYVCPGEGSAGFAFAYIRSEAVYYFLQTDTEGWEMLRDYIKQGVLTVSPITMSLAVELISRGIRDVKLNEDAKEVRGFLQVLAKRFYEIEEAWRVYAKHFGNLQAKELEIDRAYKQLRQFFNWITHDSQIKVDEQSDLPS
jgi:DNA recombination protein RmuC